MMNAFPEVYQKLPRSLDVAYSKSKNIHKTA